MTDLIEVHATVRGATAPADHYYLLHSCIKTQCCRRLTERGWQLRPIQGGERDGDILRLDRGETTLQMRIPRDDHKKIGALTDCTLQIGGHLLMIDEPTVQPVEPAPNLVSECVYISHEDRGPQGLYPGDLGAAIGKRIGAQLGHVDFGIVVGGRVTWDLQGTTLHGSRVRVQGLGDDESMWLQHEGIGEKNSWGCGTFWAE